MEPGIYIVLAIIVLLIIIVISNIKIVPQAYVFVVERLGAFHAAWGTGLHVKVPFIDRVAKRVSIKEQVVDFKPQSVITKDNVTMQIDTVVFFQITNAMQFTYGPTTARGSSSGRIKDAQGSRPGLSCRGSCGRRRWRGRACSS